MTDYRRLLEERRMSYQTKLRAIDPYETGLVVVCPACRIESWILLSDENDYFQGALQICCPAACGHYSSISDFSPHASLPNLSFDEDFICPRDKTRFKTFGAIHRCPVCAIENPREVMNNCADRVLASTSTLPNDLADQLGSLVSTFDGVMRQCNRIALQNAAHLNTSHPRVKSFQDAATAQQTLASVLDISKYVQDWPKFLETFQKRHSLSHSLGVIDQKYIEKTGISPSQIGRKIQLSKQQIDQFANDCKAIVRGYFGHFLS
jgi:hypothetical protein